MPLKLKVTLLKTPYESIGAANQHDALHQVYIKVNRKDLEEQLWPTVATIEVLDGTKKAQFNVRLSTKQSGRGTGRPICEVSTVRETGNAQPVRKDVTGSYWLDN